MTTETHLNSHSSSFFERVSNFGPEVNAFSGWYISAIFKNIVLISNPVFCFFLRLVLSWQQSQQSQLLMQISYRLSKGFIPLFCSTNENSNWIFFPTYFTYRNHYETERFTSFENWVPFGNHMSACYRNLLYKSSGGELKVVPGRNSIQNTTPRDIKGYRNKKEFKNSDCIVLLARLRKGGLIKQPQTTCVNPIYTEPHRPPIYFYSLLPPPPFLPPHLYFRN